MAEEKKTEAERLDDLIDTTFGELEETESIDDRFRLITELKSYLEIRERFFNPSVAEAKARELEYMLEKQQTEIRRRELMEEAAKVEKRNSTINTVCAVSNTVSNIGLGITDKIQHAGDVNKALTVEAGGHLTTPFAKSWEQKLANR